MISAPEKFRCEFCKASFSREVSILKHACEQKTRHMQRDHKQVKIAFMVFGRVYAKFRRPPPSYDSFARNGMYRAFVKFAKHIIDLSMIDPMSYVDFLLRTEVPIDRWINAYLYARYIHEQNKNEGPWEAVERSILLMQEWSIETCADFRDFFHEITPVQATTWIINGRISPWLLFIAPNAPNMMKRLNPEQQQLVRQTVDPVFWRAKMARHRDKVTDIRAFLIDERI